MERARPPRSGIPTLVGSPPGQQGRAQHIYSPPWDRPGTAVDTSRYHSPVRKERSGGNTNGRHSSPRPSRHAQHLHSNGHEGRSPTRQAQVTNGEQTRHQSPRHRPPTGRVPAMNVHLRRNKTSLSPQRDGMLERNVVGCETEADPYASAPCTGNFPCPDGQESAAFPEEMNGHVIYNGAQQALDVTAGSSKNQHFEKEAGQLKNVSISAQSSGLVVASESKLGEIEVKNQNCDSQNNGNIVDQTSAQANGAESAGAKCESDYPIMGTISPLSSKIAVKRPVGSVEEVSFVFGRPASPNAEDQSAASNNGAKCPTTIGYSNPRNRCMSPPGVAVNTNGFLRKSARSMSPSSDVLPQRRAAYRDGRRVLSPPPVLGVGSAAEPRIHHQGGICCEQCNGCLVELKRQALRLMFPDNGADGYLAQSIRVDNIAERLHPPEPYDRWYSGPDQSCAVCHTSLARLRHEAVVMVQSIQLAQTSSAGHLPAAAIPGLVGSCGLSPQHRARLNARQGMPPSPYASSASLVSSSSSSSSVPLAVQAQAYLEQNVRAYINPKKYPQMQNGRPAPSPHQPAPDTGHYATPGSPAAYSDISSLSSPSSSSTLSSPHKSPQYQHPNYHQHQHFHHQWPGYAHAAGSPQYPPPQGSYQPVPFRGVASPTNLSPGSPPPVPSAAVSFFARAAQKLGKKKKRHHSIDQDVGPPPPTFPTSYSDVIRLTPPPAPPCLLRTVGRLQNPGMGKVKVMLKICTPAGQGQGEQASTFLSADPRKKQVTVFDPSASGYVTSANRKAGTSAPKMFAFDSVFTPDDSLTELCASSLAEIVQAVVAGADGCLFTYGYSKLGKTYTMLGTDQGPGSLGVMPCAVAWLFRLINEQKDKTGARFSVRVSAVQVSGREEKLRDLLADIAQGAEATGVGAAPSVYLREDPICGTQLENQSELRAPTAEKAAFYLDAALAARSAADEEEARSSHLLFTLNVYQYRIEKSNTKAGLPGVAGGRSRLHLIDLGTTSKSKDPNNVSLSLSALGNVVMALLNGQRHVPHRDSKIAQLLRDSLGNLSCRTCMIAHVSSAVPHYNESLQVIQLAARIHRMKRRRTKFSSTSSEDSSTDGDAKFRRPYRGLRMGTLREDVLYSSSLSDPDYTSSSEQSCDTVIYIGANGQSLSDRELTDNEGPPRHVPRTNPRLPRRPSGSRSSGDDSDSGRSVRSVRSVRSIESGRLPVRRLMSASPTPCSPQSMPGSPNPGLVKLGHRMGLGTKMGSPSDARTLSAASSSGDCSVVRGEGRPTKMHCHSSQSKLAKAIHDKKEPMEGEQWIDGPAAAIYPEPSSSELWVDGPQAFVVQQQPLSGTPPAPTSSSTAAASSSSSSHHHHHHHRSDSSSRTRLTAPKKVNAEEHWVDGPREMLSSGSVPAQPMHTTCKAAETLRDAGKQLAAAPHQPPKVVMSTGVSEKALKQALAKHIKETKDRPESMQSADSDSSLAVEAAESRPVSFTSSEDQQTKSSDCVKMETAGQCDTTSTAQARKQKLSEQKKAQGSPSPSLASTRKCSKPETPHVARLQKSQLPSSSSPTHRVVQWIKSVSTESPPPCESTAQQKVITEQPGHVTSTQEDVADTVCPVAMTDAETNTEHDSDFERMAEENGLRSSGSDGSPGGISPSTATAGGLKQGASGTATSAGREDRCNAMMVSLDTSLDSSFDTSMTVNQESIYEMEVEERLDYMKSKDGSRLAADVDNETFSSLSCSMRDLDEGERDPHCSEIESLLVQHTKALTESRQTAQINRHLARGDAASRAREGSPDFNGEVVEVCRPLISRKPDGASNPNLNKLCFEEDSLHHRQHFYHNPMDVMFVTGSSNDFSSTSLKDQDSCFCDDDTQGGGEGLAKLAPKDNKPPLPGRPLPPTPRQQHSSLPRPCGSNPSTSPRSIYCTAKPLLHSGSKDATTKSSQHSSSSSSSSPPGIKASSPAVKSKFFRGGEKTGGAPSCSSSSGISPGSSATSSPLVSSSASKSSSSSPAPLKGKASSGGATSKLPSLCSSSRTSSPSSKDKTKKKDKDGGKSASSRGAQLSDNSHKGKGNDSDSGNDSGIVAHEQRLLSPYATVTKPRTQSHSSSGHGSDQSTISTEVHPGHSRPGTKTEILHGGTSSGYESMLRDSEAGTSSGHEESGSESSTDRKKGSKRNKGTRRSRSAPARSPESSPASSSQPSQAGSRACGPANRAWADTRHLQKIKDEPLEMKMYETDEVERLTRRKAEEGESKTMPGDSIDAKDRIEMDRNGWSFDCKMLLCFSCKSKQAPTDV